VTLAELSSVATDTADDTSFQIGRYEIRGEIGRGSMGIVYEAYDPSLRRTIALKTFHLSFGVSPQQYESLKGRFFAEARIAARLSHPGIVAVHDVGCDPEIGTLYIALEYIQGRTLQAVIADGVRLDWREGLGITRRVAEALHYAHSQKVVHRDIKPANIMLLPSGEPKILDFGIARMETTRSKLTTCAVFGTPLFMAPEQALGQRPDGRADLFSLGSIAYTLLTGRLAFAAPSIPATVRRLLEHDPEPPSRLVPDLPPEVDQIISRALAKSPEHRYSCGMELVEDIRALLDPARTDRGKLLTEPAKNEGRRAEDSPAIEGDAALEACAPPHLDDLAAPVGPGQSGLDVDHELAALVSSPVVSENAPRAANLRGTPRPVHLVLIALLAALSVSYLTLRGQSRRAEEPTGPTPVSIPSQSLASATPASADGPAPPVPTTAVVPDPPRRAPSRPERPVSRPINSVSQPLASATPASADGPVVVVESARLRIDFEHPLKSGTLRLWIDTQMVLQQELESHDTTSIPGLRLQKGRLDREIALKPGEHQVRAEVQWDDNDRQQTLSGAFQAGASRLLEINLGRLRKNLSMEWK
jgi:eukaryotic-like serine/threonine-protein kinase